jgi:hypothetical protein
MVKFRAFLSAAVAVVGAVVAVKKFMDAMKQDQLEA